MHNFQGLEGQLARWLEQLASFQYKIVHRPGCVHANADALSRLPAFLLATSPTPTEGESGESSVSQAICAVQRMSSVVPPGPGEGDELAQAQWEDAELQQVIALKGGEEECVQPPSELQKFAPVWAQLQVQGARLVRLPMVNSDAAVF